MRAKIKRFLDWVYITTEGQFITHGLLSVLLIVMVYGITAIKTPNDINTGLLQENNEMLRVNQEIILGFNARSDRVDLLIKQVEELEDELEKERKKRNEN